MTRATHTTGNGDETAVPGTKGLLLRHQPNDEDVASIAAFAASDSARMITATEIDFTGGAVIDRPAMMNLASQTLPVSCGPYQLHAEVIPDTGVPVVLMHDRQHPPLRPAAPTLGSHRPMVLFDFLGRATRINRSATHMHARDHSSRNPAWPEQPARERWFRA